VAGESRPGRAGRGEQAKETGEGNHRFRSQPATEFAGWKRWTQLARVSMPDGCCCLARGKFGQGNQFAALDTPLISNRRSCSPRCCGEGSRAESGRPEITLVNSCAGIKSRTGSTRFGAACDFRIRSCITRRGHPAVSGSGRLFSATAAKGRRGHVRNAETSE